MSEEKSLGHFPEKAKWEFDASVAKCFDDMLKRSIPEYEAMRALTTALAKRYVKGFHRVIDLGASRGEAIAALVADPELVRRGLVFQAVETSPAMLAELRARWPEKKEPTRQELTAENEVRVYDMDLRRDFPHSTSKATVVLSVLTLQFVPVEHRLRILRDCCEALRPGGAMILVEKVLGASSEIDEVMVDEYYAGKRAAGYSQEEIDAKRESLEGVLVPLTAKWNEDLLRAAGFSQVDCFWASLNFRGWIALR